ncbi:MAG: hypothetical protein U1A78_29590 [Polyangia bacterium]
MAAPEPERIADGLWRGLVELAERHVKPHLVALVRDALDSPARDEGEADLDARELARVARWHERHGPRPRSAATAGQRGAS